MSPRIETWLESIIGFLCFGGALAVIYGLVMVFGPEMVR